MKVSARVAQVLLIGAGSYSTYILSKARLLQVTLIVLIMEMFRYSTYCMSNQNRVNSNRSLFYDCSLFSFVLSTLQILYMQASGFVYEANPQYPQAQGAGPSCIPRAAFIQIAFFCFASAAYSFYYYYSASIFEISFSDFPSSRGLTVIISVMIPKIDRYLPYLT